MDHPNRKSQEAVRVCLIGGSDSSGGAGLQVDTRTLNCLGVSYSNVVTSITAQDDKKFVHREDVSTDSLRSQLNSCLKKKSLVKIGMIGKHLPELVDFFIARDDLIILDPVFFSSSQGALFASDDLELLIHKFFPKVFILTPNIAEAEMLWGQKIKTSDDVEKAAKYLNSLGVCNVLIKGGHLASGDDLGDFFSGGGETFWIKSHRINRLQRRGTGCFLATAWAGGLALGLDKKDALVMARIFLHKSLRSGKGAHLYPTDFFKELKACDMPWVQRGFRDSPSFTRMSPSENISLYPIVDRAFWLEKLKGANFLIAQLRIKDLESQRLEEEIKEAISLAKKLGIDLFINDYWELALKYKAFGVHLGQEDLERADLVALQKAKIRLGISTHSYFEAAKAKALNPSYLAFGPVYHTLLKVMKFGPQGTDKLKLWRELFDLPLVGIGGITLERAPEVMATRADYICVVRDILLNKDPLARARSWTDKLDRGFLSN
jgi:hydroxymethylpyrimidine kinase/phosphomethylpyrimidine kinase/thiamine-phosphate diphosphorylase